MCLLLAQRTRIVYPHLTVRNCSSLEYKYLSCFFGANNGFIGVSSALNLMGLVSVRGIKSAQTASTCLPALRMPGSLMSFGGLWGWPAQHSTAQQQHSTAYHMALGHGKSSL